MSYQPDKNLLNERIILVTGAGDGIGRTAALTFAAHGATVILSGRTTEKLEQVYDAIVAAGNREPGIAPMDLSLAGQAEMTELTRVIAENYGRLDGLLHNAAILGERVPFDLYGIEQWQRVMQVNFTAVFLLTRLLMPLLRESKDARVVFTSSTVGETPRAYWGAYAVSKYAMEGFAKLMADELEQTSAIRVNILNPGGTRTAMRAAAYPAEDPRSLKTPEDIMPLYLYLMGPDSREEHGRTFTPEWSAP